MTDWRFLQPHPYAEFLPVLSVPERSQLADSIEEHGYFPDEPIVLFEGKVLDGRNRLAACVQLRDEGRLSGEPAFREWRPENGSGPLEWVVAKNIQRRHLTPSQRAMIAAEILPRFEEQARQRRLANLRRGAASPVSETIRGREKGKASEAVAAVLSVNSRYVEVAKKIRAAAPDLVEKVKKGAVSLQEARSEVKKRRRPQPGAAPRLPEGTFNVFYADPPWQYDFCSVDDWAVENSYPTLDRAGLCALAPKVQEVAAEHAILFLWATSPKLPEALSVLAAWGFTYKTSAVWVKHRTGAGMGYYVRVDHEFLLIGTRGKFGPPPPELRSSSVLEAPKGRHSEKPEEARRLIERMYPEASRLELFARGERQPGWQVWGNEIGP